MLLQFYYVTLLPNKLFSSINIIIRYIHNNVVCNIAVAVTSNK